MSAPSRGAALVTGAGRRIGRVLAVELACAGFDVAVHFHSSEAEARETAAMVESHGRRAAVVRADLAAPEGLVEAAAGQLGPLSVLINNASVFQDDRIETFDRESWNAHLDTNLWAPVALAQAFARQAPEGSVIINLIDQRVWKPTPQFLSYSISKAGLWFATRTLAQALAPRIRVNAVAPGPTLPSIHQQPGEFEAEARNTPLERRATPEEVARAVLYLVDAPSVTGQMIAVDGGQHLAWRTTDVTP